jgi:diguanylate cyclase (GGDEF)-like protein/PAS domain S-box-containing protein
LTDAHNQFFRALFDTAFDATVVVDEQGEIILANAACEKLLGYSPAELFGRSVETLVPVRFQAHAELRGRFLGDPHARSMGQGMALYARHADGRDVPVDIALNPVSLGPRRWTSAVIRDMRGRAHGMEALRVQATALRSAANGVVITDRGGTITWVNPAACAITGYHPEELIGRHTRILKSGEHDQPFYADLWSQVTRGETWTGTIVNRRKDGALYHEEQTIAPVFDSAGEVSHFIAIKQDVSERWKAEDALARAHEALTARSAEIEALNRKLREQAIRDPLTNLYNRRYLEEAIEREVSRAARTGEPLAIAALDLDRFKDVNDRHGHACGDLVLQAFARVLVEHARSSDLICRTGGEEFLVVLPGASLPVALARSEEWRASFAGAMTENAAGSPIRCTVSIGLSLLRPGREDFASAYRRADAALYEAKRTGRNRVVTAEPAA